MSNNPTFPSNIKALFFDCFGTVVDWRSTVTNALHSAAKAALSDASSPTQIPLSVKSKAQAFTLENWGQFAAQWRKSYTIYVQAVANDPSIPYKTIDEHHLGSLRELLVQWQLDGLWTEDQINTLSVIWHFLDPWPDSSTGIVVLNRAGYQTATLSNGNVSLLSDMAEHADLQWTHIISAEMFGTYKPNRRVYQGAAERLGLGVEECGMVAAHLGDLKAAKEAGFGAVVYVEREGEEGWSGEQVVTAKGEGWVDVWVELGEKENGGGFLEVAERLEERGG